MTLRERAASVLFRIPARRPAPAQPAAPEAGATARTFAATVLGMRGEELERIVGAVLGMGERAGMLPVFIADALDLRVFLLRSAAVEVLPYPSGRVGGSPVRWRLYRDEECRRIGRIWMPGVVLEYGRPLEPGQIALLRSPALEWSAR